MKRPLVILLFVAIPLIASPEDRIAENLQLVKAACKGIVKMDSKLGRTGMTSAPYLCLQRGTQAILEKKGLSQLLIGTCDFSDIWAPGPRITLQSHCYRTALPLAFEAAVKDLANTCLSPRWNDKAWIDPQCVEESLRKS